MTQAFLFTVSLATSVAADDGDDFVNNLFSDLAPLLALFGERVTMQFVSQSLGWADNIILAMVPLGIITIIVSAIRVGGPGFLKALIDRARENLAVAEQELMSSTSTEVCELWNGHEVVRCMGSAPVAEFICLLPESGVTDGVQVEVMPFDKVKNQYFTESETSVNLLRKAMSLNLSTSPEQDREKSSHSANTPNSRIIVTRNPRKSSPNITLNSHNITSRAELRIAAVWGIVLQLGLIAYAGCSVHNPALGLLKDDKPVAQYAFPCHWVGTLLLVVDLLLCGHVVESSTIEEQFRPSQKLTAQLVWLQQTKTVSDQVFDSFAIYAKTKRPFITTSDRRRDERKPPTSPLNQEVVSAIAPVNEKPGISLEVKTSIGTVVSLCGYIVQFCGLRGLHWSVSIAQLGAILLMAGLRAWVRRGLANPPRSLQTRPGFELDWFATTFADIPNSPWIPDAKYKIQEWRIRYLQAHVKKFEERVPQESSTVSTAHRVVMIRRDLAQLASWQGPASAEAVSLARSIEATVNALFSDSEQDNYTWSLATQSGDSEEELIYFRLNRINGIWNAHADELEAALSIWLFSVDRLEKNGGANHQDIVGDKKDDKWLRVRGSPSRPGLRLLGSYTEGLHRDLSWWMPSETTRIIRLSRLTNLPGHGITTDGLCKEDHRVVGPGGSAIDRRRYVVEELPEFTIETRQLQDDESVSYENGRTSPPATECDTFSHDFIAAEFHGPLKLLYAQDIFSSFFRTVAMTLQKPLLDIVETRPKLEATDDRGWKSFVLHNGQLSKLAKDIEDTGLGSLGGAYLSMISALSMGNRLSQGSVIIELAREKARRYESLQHWQQAGEIYLWLFRVATTVPLDNYLSTLATVMTVDFLGQLYSALDLARRQVQGCDRSKVPDHLSASLRDLEDEIDFRIHNMPEVEPTFSALMELYEDQGRPWGYDPYKFGIRTSNNRRKSSDRYPEKFHYTELHEAARTGDADCIDKIIEDVKSEEVNARDILGWTPLHYGVRQHDIAAALMKSPWIDVNARDLVEWTPLHYACKTRKNLDDKIDGRPARHHDPVGSMPYSTILRLIKRGADINAQGRDGVAPIHCAAITGLVETVELLAEAGAEINVLDGSGKTALHWAAFYGRQATVEYLWETANRALRDREGRTALHLAAISGKWEIAIWLANHDADITAMDWNTRVPLHQVAWAGRLDLVQLLCEKCPDDVDFPDVDGLTPLGCAVENGQKEVVQWLLEKTSAGRDLEHSSIKLDSFMLSVIKQNRADIAEFLIGWSNWFLGRFRDEKRVLRECVIHGNEEIFEMLLKAGLEEEEEEEEEEDDDDDDDDYGISVIGLVDGDEKKEIFVRLLKKYNVRLS
ncbi:hypothetical protein CNYM01_07876 [Colletotrichum nymphaeae SA-01]|uniref:Uncharacterized protein n=1 Tax=Colletotrichum nymphaeae SA-01 TaxID=1460502 RepID=A0A135UWQ9_9PEZI|nr:hypothetical protein CNYM01_07876 [Colletotrichum nymphaeae SA-01]